MLYFKNYTNTSMSCKVNIKIEKLPIQGNLKMPKDNECHSFVNHQLTHSRCSSFFIS